MLIRSLLMTVIIFLSLGASYSVALEKNMSQKNVEKQNDFEIDPFSANIQQQLNEMDQDYIQQTGKSPFLNSFRLFELSETCLRETCALWAQVVKSTQTMYVFINGQHTYTWKTSTGAIGHDTPNFDRHPNGRIYDEYSSSKYPGGDYNGLGNMPYAVFIEGGFAIHGTPRGNWARLGTRASHGCIRIHPDNAEIFNRLVRQLGVDDTWITVQD